MFAHVGENEIGRNRCHLIQPGLSEFALDIIVNGEPVASIRLHGDVCCLPGGVSRQQLRYIGFGSTWFPPVEELRRPEPHSARGRAQHCHRID
jgi:hypothetical protein